LPSLDFAQKSIQFDDKEIAWVESGRELYDLLAMLWDPDGTKYKERKFRWRDPQILDRRCCDRHDASGIRYGMIGG